MELETHDQALTPRGAEPLATRLSQALATKGMTIDAIAERTKVPRATVRALLGSQEPAVLPQRIYLRGHLSIVARELGLDVADTLRHFDAENPAVESRVEAEIEKARFSPVTMAVAAGLGGIAIFAVILAFVR